MVTLTTPCASDPKLFDSIDLLDHYEARELCLSCSTRTSCALIAHGDREADGTYGGLLFRHGKVAVRIRAGKAAIV